MSLITVKCLENKILKFKDSNYNHRKNYFFHSIFSILLKNNGLHIEIQIDHAGQVGQMDAAGVQDLLVEAAITTIMDCEDSVAAVDGEDKALAYRNWLGLMKGDLQESLEKNGKTIVRSLNPDRQYTSVSGGEISLKGRSMLFVRNVGHLMTNPAIIDEKGNEVPEGIMDGMITSLIAMHDLKGNSPYQNSTANSINIVKPKMHGPEEVAFTKKHCTSIMKYKSRLMSVRQLLPTRMKNTARL